MDQKVGVTENLKHSPAAFYWSSRAHSCKLLIEIEIGIGIIGIENLPPIQEVRANMFFSLSQPIDKWIDRQPLIT